MRFGRVTRPGKLATGHSARNTACRTTRSETSCLAETGSLNYATLSVGETFSVVLAAFIARAAPPATRFQAQIALPVLSEVVANTTLFTEAGQSVAAPVAKVFCAHTTADG